MNDDLLAGRTALVTGASRGIGAATARALDTAGARVALSARSSDALHEVAGTMTHEPVVLTADLADTEAPAGLAGAALDALGKVDVLVNNAATAARLDTVDTDAALIDTLLALNVRAPLLLIAALIPSMIERGGGSVIKLSSVSGVVGTPRRAAYAATKGALDAATRSLAVEFGPHRIRINSVAPGWWTLRCGNATRSSRAWSNRWRPRRHFGDGLSPMTSPMSSCSSHRMPPASSPARRFR